MVQRNNHTHFSGSSLLTSATVLLLLINAFAPLRCVTQILVQLYLLLMGCVACQLYTPISLQCRSSLFLKALTDVASITVCGSLFHDSEKRKSVTCGVFTALQCRECRRGLAMRILSVRSSVRLAKYSDFGPFQGYRNR